MSQISETCSLTQTKLLLEKLMETGYTGSGDKANYSNYKTSDQIDKWAGVAQSI
jgi:hypothetical protein